MKKIILLFSFCFLLLPAAAWAQTPTPKASPTATITPSPTPTDRLQEIKDRIEERIQEIREKGQKRAVWGILKQINNSTLVLESARGERMVKTTAETKVTLDKKDIKIADLGIGNFLIALGTMDQSDNFVAARILAYSKPPKLATKRQAIYGKVTDISSVEKVLTVTHPKKPSTVYEVKVNDKTIITKKVDDKIKKVNFEAITIGDRIVAVAIQDKDSNSFTAKLIHVIPGKATGLEKITPTPTTAGTTKTSPTPTKKPTPTPTE